MSQEENLAKVANTFTKIQKSKCHSNLKLRNAERKEKFI